MQAVIIAFIIIIFRAIRTEVELGKMTSNQIKQVKELECKQTNTVFFRFGY